MFAVIVLSSAACGEHRQQATPNTVAAPASTELPAAASDRELPLARNGEALIEGVPVVVVERERILIDDQVVGSVQGLDTVGRMARVDAEFEALKAKREAWRAAHPTEAYPGVALLRVHRATKALVVKSVFQTAAFSGHPNLAFVVEADGAKGQLARLNVDAFVQRVVRSDFRKFRQCYEDGLHKDPKLAGKVAVRFVIGSDGKVASAADGGSDLPNPAVVRCVIQSFSSLTFPPPENGKVTVVYPIQFTP